MCITELKSLGPRLPTLTVRFGLSIWCDGRRLRGGFGNNMSDGDAVKNESIYQLEQQTSSGHHDSGCYNDNKIHRMSFRVRMQFAKIISIFLSIISLCVHIFGGRCAEVHAYVLPCVDSHDNRDHLSCMFLHLKLTVTFTCQVTIKLDTDNVEKVQHLARPLSIVYQTLGSPSDGEHKHNI